MDLLEHLIARPGETQEGRAPEGLARGYAQVDERSARELYEYARKLSEQVRFYYVQGGVLKDDLDHRTGLYRIPVELPAGEKERPSELVARTRGPSAASFTDAGDLYFTSTAVFKNFYDRDDVFFLPKGARAQV